MIYAVIWFDLGTRLHLPKPSAEQAITLAKQMHDKAVAAGIKLGRLRAVSLDEADNLVSLWEAPA